MDHNKAPLHVYLRSFLIENATLCNQWWYIIHRFHKHLLPSVRGWITPPPNHRWIKTLVFNSPQGCHFPGTHLSGGNTEHRRQTFLGTPGEVYTSDEMKGLRITSSSCSHAAILLQAGERYREPSRTWNLCWKQPDPSHSCLIQDNCR